MKKIISFMAMALTIIMFVTSCDKGDSLMKYVPSESQVVIKANIASLAEKSAIGQNADFKAQVNSIAESAPAAAKEKVKAIIEKPEEAGFALDKSAVVALIDVNSSKFMFGLNVADKAKVDELIKAISADDKNVKITEGDITTVDAGDVTMAYNDAAFIMASGAKAIDYLNLDESKSVASCDNCKAIAEAQSDLSVLVDYEAVMGMASAMSGQAAPTSELTKGLKLLANVEFKDKEAVLAVEALGNEKYMELCKETSATPSGDFLKYVPEDAYFAMQVGAKNLDKCSSIYPKATLDMINQQLTALGLNFEQIMKAVDGDILLTVAPNGEQAIPQFAFVLACKDAAVWQAISKQFAAAGPMIAKKDDNNYTVNAKDQIGMNYNITYDSKVIAIVPETAPAKAIEGADADVLKKGGMFINIAKILANPFVQQAGGEAAASLKAFTAITATTEGNKSNVTIKFAEEGNSLAALIKFAQTGAGSMMQLLGGASSMGSSDVVGDGDDTGETDEEEPAVEE